MTDNGLNTFYLINHSGAPFAGRTAELDRLSRMLATTDANHLRAVFITGEAGIGKTRLVQEFVDEAAKRGWQVWKTESDPMSLKQGITKLG